MARVVQSVSGKLSVLHAAGSIPELNKYLYSLHIGVLISVYVQLKSKCGATFFNIKEHFAAANRKKEEERKFITHTCDT